MHQSTYGKSLDLPALCAAERLFIWGFRAKARSGSAVPTAADIQQVYDHFRVGDAVPSLESIIEIFACTAHTAIEVHCPTCPKMSDSEHGILRAIAAAQQERIDVAREQFESWLPPVGAWKARSKHSSNSSRSTGRDKSRRLRTVRVVDNS